MATVVYQGSQTCFQSHLTETRALRLRLSSPNPHFSHQFPLEPFPALKSCNYLESAIDKETFDKKDTSNSSPQDKNEAGGAQSFLQALSCSSSISKDTTMYVHPLAKRSTSVILSEKSLALCTEGLGNETGTDAIEITSSILPILFSEEEEAKEEEAGNSHRKEAVVSHRRFKSKRRNVRDGKPNFPHPLTTLREGGECIQVRSHRVDGRIVIQATMIPPKRHCFQAERCNGRLRLSFFKDYSPPCEFDLEQETRLKNDKEEKQGMMEKLVMGRGCVEDEKENRGLFKREPYLVSMSSRRNTE